VSINNTNNTYRFDVNGTVRFTGQLRLESTITDGTYTYTLPSATGTLALTSQIPANPVGGTGTTNYLPKFTGASTIGNSLVSESGSIITIAGSLYSSGTLRLTGSSSVDIQAYTGSAYSNLNYDAASHNWQTSGGTAKMVLNASGNLGLGVTPSDWFVVHKVMQLGGNFSGTSYAGAFTSQTNDNVINLFNNAYVNSSNAETYYASAEAAKYVIRRNAHEWYNAPSGTAGNAISFTQAMTLNASGNLMLGTTSISNPISFIRLLNISGGDAALVLSNSNGTAKNWSVGALDSGSFAIYDGSTFRFSIASTGAATFSSSVTATQFGVADGQKFLSNGGTQSYYAPNSGASEIGYQTTLNFRAFNGNSPVSAMFMSSGGNVGIGTSTPGQKLSIAGRLNFDTFSTDIDDFGMWATSSGTTISSYSTSNIMFRTNATERARITSAGELCVGRTSAYGAGFLVNVEGNIYASAAIVAGSSVTATSGLTVGSLGSGSDAIISLATNASGAPRTIYYKASTATINFTGTGGTDLMTLTNGGNLGIGTTSPGNRLHVTNTGGSLSTLTDIIGRFNATTNTAGQGSAIALTAIATKETGVILGAEHTSGSNGDFVVRIYNGGADYPERMRITSGGGVGIGKTASVTGLDVYYADTDGVNSRSGAAAGPSRSLYTGWHSASGTTSGTLSFNVVTNGNVTNTNNSYGSLSDIKLKENIIDTTPKLADLLKVRIVNYNLIGQESKQIGVIAQELETIFPSMIEEYFDKDIYGNDLKTKSKGVKYSVFVPMLIKAVQELKQELDTLKNK
jgi:hypothetical protein